MKLAFVIPAYNEEVLIGKCLESVVAEIKRSGADADVIVVNNASKDRTGEIARSFEGVRVVDEPNKGLVNARHAGFAASGNASAGRMQTTAPTIAPISRSTAPRWRSQLNRIARSAPTYRGATPVVVHGTANCDQIG